MDETASLAINPLRDGRKRRRQDSKSDVGSDGDEPSKKFKCEPCNRSFTEHKSLLRHQRENKKHRCRKLAIHYAYICDMCQKSFARAYDLGRHRKEQHLGGKIACPACGKLIRENTPHKVSTGAQCNGRSNAAGLKDPVNSRDERTELDRPQGIPEAACNSIMDSLTEQLSKTSLGRTAAMDIATYKKQVRTKTSRVLLPCGICHSDFEVNNYRALLQHLKNHFASFNGGYICAICDISFVHEGDLKKHELNAAAGDCGFKFLHKAPCPGHHRPSRNKHSPALALDNSEDDRFNFAYRLREWEQAQLSAFICQLQPLVKGKLWGFKRKLGLGRERKDERDDGATIWTEVIPRNLSPVHDHAISAAKSHVPRLEYHSFHRRRNQPPGETPGTPGRALPTDMNESGGKSYTAQGEAWKALDISESSVYNPSGDNFHFTDESVVESMEQFFLDEFFDPMSMAPSETNDLEQRCFNEYLAQMLCEAVFKGDVDQMALAISCGADLNAVHGLLQPPLHFAASIGHPDVVCLLLKFGADVNICDRNGKTPLLNALSQGSWEVARVLIRHRAMDRAIREGHPVIHAALHLDGNQNDIVDMLMFLIENGASVHTLQKSGISAFERAVNLGLHKVVKFLLINGVNLVQQPTLGTSSMTYAILNRDVDVAKLLNDNGAIVRGHHLEAANRIHADQVLEVLVDNWDGAELAHRPNLTLLNAISKCNNEVMNRLVERRARSIT